MWTSVLFLALGAPPDSLGFPAEEVEPQPFTASLIPCAGAWLKRNRRISGSSTGPTTSTPAKSPGCAKFGGATCGPRSAASKTRWLGRHNARSPFTARTPITWPPSTANEIRTSRSSLGELKDKRTSIRRIELVADRNGNLAALPREMTEIVLADLLGGNTPPCWASDGIAIFADNRELLKLHQQELQIAFDKQLDFPMIDILHAQEIPPKDRATAFKGQCASLASFLIHRDKP